MNEQERTGGIAKRMVNDQRLMDAIGWDMDCFQFDEPAISFIASQLLIYGDTRAREAVEECAKVTVGIASTDELRAALAGLSMRKKESYEAGWYNSMGSIQKAIRTLLPTPSPTPATKQEEGR